MINLNDAALARIHRIMQVLAVAGTIGGTVWLGWAHGAGFLLGSLASILNFGWWKKVVDGMGPQPDGSPAAPAKSTVIRSVARFAVAFAIAYVILRFTPVPLEATLAGLLVAVAAVILEIVYELTYA